MNLYISYTVYLHIQDHILHIFTSSTPKCDINRLEDVVWIDGNMLLVVDIESLEKIGRMAGWIKSAMYNHKTGNENMKKVSGMGNMMGVTGHSGGEVGEWKSYTDNDRERFDVAKLSNDALGKIKDTIGYKTSGEQLKLGGYEYGTVYVMRSGQQQHVSESTTHGYRADLDYTENVRPEHYNKRDEKQDASVIIENLQTTGHRVTVKAYASFSPLEYLSLRGRSGGPASVASMVIKRGSVEVDIHELEQSWSEKKKPGFFARLFGKATSYGWVKTASGWTINKTG